MKIDLSQFFNLTATIETISKSQNKKSLNAPDGTDKNMQYWFKDR